MQSACSILYCHLWPLRLYSIFPHYLINGMIFGKKLLNIKFLFWFSVQLLSATILRQRRIRRDVTINVYRFSCKVSGIFVRLSWNLNFLNRLFQEYSLVQSYKQPISGTRDVLRVQRDERIDRRMDGQTWRS